MAELVNDVPERTLAVYAHPDDADVASGGTLARWAKAGSEVHLVVCTDGGRGTTDPSIDPTALARRRADELTEAAGILGLSSVDVLGWPDGELEDTAAFRRDLVELVRRSSSRRRLRSRPHRHLLRSGLLQPPRPSDRGMGCAGRPRSGRLACRTTSPTRVRPTR